jgi:hypothetical protein
MWNYIYWDPVSKFVLCLVTYPVYAYVITLFISYIGVDLIYPVIFRSWPAFSLGVHHARLTPLHHSLFRTAIIFNFGPDSFVYKDASTNHTMFTITERCTDYGNLSINRALDIIST